MGRKRLVALAVAIQGLLIAFYFGAIELPKTGDGFRGALFLLLDKYAGYWVAGGSACLWLAVFTVLQLSSSATKRMLLLLPTAALFFIAILGASAIFGVMYLIYMLFSIKHF